MTDVGKISLGVEIDASDLSARLGEAVRRAITPALAEINRELNKVQQSYDDTAKSAERSATRQVAALKRVERQADATRRAVLAAAAAGGGPNSNGPGGGGGGGTSNDNRRYDNRSTNTTRNDNRTDNRKDNRRYDQRRYNYSNKYDQRTINNNQTTYDHRVYNYYGPGGPGPNPPNGPPGNRRGGGGGSGGRGGVLGFLTSPLGLNSIALGASALPAVATGVTNIVGAVQQLGQAGLALPGIFAGAAASIGTAVIGFQGIGDAVKALNEADADPKKLEEANKQLAKMAPAAADVAREVSRLTLGPLKDFQKAIAQPMLEGVADQLGTTADKVLPRIQPGMQKIAGAWNKTLKTALTELGSDDTLNIVDRIFGNTAEGQTRANAAIKPLINAFGTLAREGSEFLPRLGDAITKVSTRFEAFITKNAANGNIFRWIDEGLNGLRAFGNAILNVVKTVTNLTKAAGKLDGSLSGDGGFLGWLERATKSMADFTGSAEGQDRLTSFFKGGSEDLASIGSTLKELWPALREIIKGFQTWGEIIAPILGAVASLVGSLNEVPGLLEAIVVGFLAWRTIGGIIGGITTKLTAMRAAAGGGPGGGPGTGIFGAGNRLGTGLAGAGLLAGGTAMQQNAGDSGASQAIGALSTVGGAALLGGSIGSVIPGVGTAIGAAGGAAIGGIIAGVNFLMNENATAAAKATEAQAAYAASVAQSAEALANLQGAQKGVNDNLLAAGGDLTNAGVQTGVQAQLGALPDSLKSHFGDKTAQGVAEALKNTGLSTAEIAQQLTGAQPLFDALAANLQRMGPDGAVAAQQLALMREQIMGMQATAQTASPALTQLAEQLKLPGASDALAAVRTAVLGIPTNVPITLDMPNAPATLDVLKGLGYKIETIDGKEVVVNANDQKVKDADAALEALGVKITHLPTGEIAVQLDQAKLNAAQIDMNNFLATLSRNVVNIPVQVQPRDNGLPIPQLPGLPAPPPALGGPPRAAGGVLPGYTPRRDTLLYPMADGGWQPLSGGEGILIPEAVRGLGGAPGIYAINSMFRSGLSRKGYGMAGGGVFGADDGAVIGEPHLGTGLPPGPVGPETELSVLISIRDLLAGKGGTAVNPLAATAANTATSAKAATGTGAGGTVMGPFGTPLKPRGNLAYKAAAAAIQALGGDPTEFIGTDPDAVAATTAAALPGMPGATAGASVDVAALQRFALSGNTADLPPGIDINSPVVTAITAARNKKKGGLTDQAISDLVGQALAPGGFSGTLDESNTSLVKALEKLRTKGLPGVPAARGAAPVAGATGVNLTNLPAGMMDPVSAFAAQHSGGQYSWGASDLAAGLSDCSGAISDLVELITKGQATGERLFSTADAGSVLKSLGAVEGAIPGALQIGWSPEHMRATLPNGVNFESGGQTGQGATYGGNARGAAGMPNIMSLPVNGMPLVPGVSPMGLGSGGAGGSGTPVYVTNWPGGGGGLAGLFGKPMAEAGINAAGQAGIGVLGDIGAATTDALLTPDGKRRPNASITDLIQQRNPLAFAAMAGLDVQDFTREGGAGGPVEQNGQAYDASGRLFSDTGALVDRTMTSLNAQLQAMREQLVDVITQVADKLNDSALEPVIKNGLTAALDNLKSSITSAIGTGLGDAAAPPIADAVASAVSNLPIDQSGAGGTGGALANGNLGGVAAGLFADGGPVWGGKPNTDSVPAMLMPGEFVFNKMDVSRMGGVSGAEAFRQALGKRGGIRRMAQGGGVNVNDTVGAEFFGVSEVPILSTIVNLLVRVLLQVLGVTIEGRDTFNELTDEFRQFRGDSFKAFDAQGRLLNDTSALIDRSSSSEEVAAQERIRILKIVIQAIIKYLIEKVIVPIAKAVANAAIQAGASAAGAATNTGAPGAGGIVSSLISSAGSAGVDIAAEVGTDFALAISEQLIAVVAEGLQSTFPDLVTGLFSGAGVANLFGPLGNVLATLIGGVLGGFAGVGTGVFGGASTLIPGIPFDEGGMAHGVGYLPKATMDDELVLSPGETDLFSRFVGALERGGFGGGGNRTEVHAPITVVGGGRESADEVQNRLLALMP